MSERLQSELKKKRPFVSDSEELYLNVLRTADRLQIQFERLFRDYGLTPSQYNVLRILRGEGQPLPILEIASRTIAVVPGITGLIDRLEKGGLVQRKRCDQDRRVIYVEITAEGGEMLARLERPLAELQEKLLGHLTRDEMQTAIRLMEKCRAAT